MVLGIEKKKKKKKIMKNKTSENSQKSDYYLEITQIINVITVVL